MSEILSGHKIFIASCETFSSFFSECLLHKLLLPTAHHMREADLCSMLEGCNDGGTRREGCVYSQRDTHMHK